MSFSPNSSILFQIDHQQAESSHLFVSTGVLGYYSKKWSNFKIEKIFDIINKNKDGKITNQQAKYSQISPPLELWGITPKME